MKKLLLAALMAVASISLAVAQPHAIGANIGYGVSVSYQHNLGEANMIDLAVEFPGFYGVGATCTYDWVNPFGTKIPWNEKGTWNWSLGVGAGAGFIWGANWGYAGVVGHCGVAYDFWFPMELSVDWRPNIGACFGKGGAAYYTDGLFTGITLGIRYLF